MNDSKDVIDLVCTNRKAKYDYHVIESLEVGIVLVGHEVKSLRDHHVSLDSSYAHVADGELWLINCNIDQYKNSQQQCDPKRKRKLLLQKKQLRSFAEKATQKGSTLIPLRIYFKNGKAKVEIAVCKGKQVHDKRQSIKDRESKIDMVRRK